MDGRIDGWTDGQIDGWMEESINRLMGGWMVEWIGGWTNRIGMTSKKSVSELETLHICKVVK